MGSSNWETAAGNPLRFDTSHNDAPGIAGGEVVGTRLARAEVQTLKSPANSTATTRAVLYESWDEPGVINYLWFAFGGTGAGTEFTKWAPNYTIRIYVDDATTPVVNANLRDFFNGFGLGRPHWTPKVGIVKHDDTAAYDGFGVYRYIHAPYKRYVRVEVISSASADVAMWGHVGVKRLRDPYAGIRKLFRMDTVTADSVNLFTTHTVARSDDSKGQIESVSYGYTTTTNNAGDDNPLEGNASFFERYAQSRANWQTTGMEDLANGAFGSPLFESDTVTTSAASAGTAHTHTVTASQQWGYPAGFVNNGAGNAWLYRYFDDDPLYYFDGFQWQFNLGQAGQIVTTQDSGANLDVFSLAANVSHWSTATNSGTVPSMGNVYYNSDSDQFASLATFGGTQSVSGGVLSSSGSGGHGMGVQLPSGVAANGTAYWVEIRGRIIANSGGGGTQLYVAAGGPSNGDIIGTNACELFWGSGALETDVYVQGRSGNTILGGVMVARGEDFVNDKWINLAVQLDSVTNGERRYTYYYKLDGDDYWQPVLSSRTNGVTNSRWMTIGGYNSQVQISNVTVRQIEMVGV
jgi:hypothetical protein